MWGSLQAAAGFWPALATFNHHTGSRQVMKLYRYSLIAGKGALLTCLAACIATAQIASFQHVVVIIQENRTPDNLFQGLCNSPFGSPNSCSPSPEAGQYNIQTRNWLDRHSATGVTQPVAVPLANTYDLNHTHASFLAQCDVDQLTGACKMDGAGDVACSGTCLAKPQFRYVDYSSGVVTPYLKLASQYGFANYMFQTNQGPSFPAHQFLFGGTSAPSAADDSKGIFAAENIPTTIPTAGCIATLGTLVELIDPSGENKKIYPCFEHSTIADLLPPDRTWRYYTPSAGSIWTAPNGIDHICQPNRPGGSCVGPAWVANVDLKTADVLTDIAACKLRNISWVIPTGQNSDHARINDGGGPSWVASIVNAIGNSTSCDGGAGYWKNTAIVITWDDWGGWYDHERSTFLAPPQGDYQYGFRVPLLFVSAYTPAGYINNQRHDFGSILRFLEGTFGIKQGALNFSDSRATTDLAAFYDLSRPPRAFHTVPAPKTAAFFLRDKRKASDPDDDGDDR
jgi:phospholipase C